MLHFYRLALAFVFFLTSLMAYPAVIHVPADHTTIQAAVDAAADGDTVLIADGTYSGAGNMDIQWDATSKHLVIISEHGREHCIIDCREEGRGFLLNAGQDHRDVLEGLTITNGKVLGAGGALMVLSASPTIRNCTFMSNFAGGYHDNSYSGCGGAIMVRNESSPLIQGNIITDNVASNLGGGIVFAEYSGGILENNIIDGNTALDDWGGGITLWNNSNPSIINNLIINNSCSGFNGGRGGGIYLSHSDAKIVNNTIAYNYTSGDEYGDGFGGGICIGGWAVPLIKNCIIWHNRSGASSMNIYFDPHEWLDISYCNVEEDLGHIFDLKPYTNMDVPPEFADPENGDFQLRANSPCINRGIPDTTGLHLSLLDLSGNTRIFGDTVDIGAYEYNLQTGLPVKSDGGAFTLYPSPTAGPFYLECRADNSMDKLLVQIAGVNGGMVLEQELAAAEKIVPLDLSRQPGGIYVLRVISNGQVLFRRKIVKE